MNPWIAKALVLAGTVVMIAIRAPHGHRSRIVKVATSYKTPLETGLNTPSHGQPDFAVGASAKSSPGLRAS